MATGGRTATAGLIATTGGGTATAGRTVTAGAGVTETIAGGGATTIAGVLTPMTIAAEAVLLTNIGAIAMAANITNAFFIPCIPWLTRLWRWMERLSF